MTMGIQIRREMPTSAYQHRDSLIYEITVSERLLNFVNPIYIIPQTFGKIS